MSISSNFLCKMQKTVCNSIVRRAVLNILVRTYSETGTGILYQYDKDPAPHFLDPNVQKLLKSITRLRLDKVYRKRSVPDNSIEYKFMTTQELEKSFMNAIATAEQLLQMPPIVKIKENEEKIVSQDPALTKFADSKYVFTDISFGLTPSERKIVVRSEVDGGLKHASHDVRKRLNQVYFPLLGRKLRTPKMFDDEHLKRLLKAGEYEFILDRLCIQYEPYESEYHEKTAKVYLEINEKKHFENLRSTRHFGPMAFFLAWHKQIDDLLYDMLQRDILRNGVELILLMSKLNNIEMEDGILEKLKAIPEAGVIQEVNLKLHKTHSDDIHEQIKTAIGKTADDFKADDLCIEFIENYIKSQALKKSQLELAIQTLRETNEEKKKLFEGLLKAHGVAS